MKFLFTCSGTAGHINPALATADELLRIVPDAKILFIGAGREMEKRLIPKAGYELKNIRMSGLKRGLSPADMIYNVKTMRNLVTAGSEAAKIIRQFKPQVVIGTGGYVCYPIIKKAAKMGIPTIIHESNAVPGLATKLLSSIVDKVLVSFPGLENNYKRPERVIYTGTPVRGGFEVREENDETGEFDRKPLVVSFWGSLGAERMNEIISEFIMLNIAGGEFDHIHATGGQDGVADMQNRLKRSGAPEDMPPGIEIRDYIDDMQSTMSAANLVLCRAGGSTIAELTAAGKPAVLIPSPYVSNNEQEKNAQQLHNIGGVIVLEEKNCSGGILFKTITELLKDKQKLKKMTDAQRALAAPKAAEKIAELIIDIIIP